MEKNDSTPIMGTYLSGRLFALLCGLSFFVTNALAVDEPYDPTPDPGPQNPLEPIPDGGNTLLLMMLGIGLFVGVNRWMKARRNS